jgi:hypothetical protein
MLANANLQEYLDEIRAEVCSRCVERPPDGPPCAPLGKMCGVELHLPTLVAAVREVHSDWMGPYLDKTHENVCQSCACKNHDCCPCPMDRLAMLVVEAVEAVDERRKRQARGSALVENLPPAEIPAGEHVFRTYKDAAGTWTGCDWPTGFAGLDLKGVSASEAETLAVESIGTAEVDAWESAARWLRDVERRARQAEREAALAVSAVNAGAWQEAVAHARRAWALEFHTGRPLRHAQPTWEPFFRAVKTAAKKHNRGNRRVSD